MARAKGAGDKRMRGSARRDMWRSMRIMRTFDISQVAKTAGATYENAKKFVSMLVRHGYLARRGTRYIHGFSATSAGMTQAYALVNDCGPEPPVRCNKCGRAISQKCEVQGD